MFTNIKTLSPISKSQLSEVYMQLVNTAASFDDIAEFDKTIGYQPKWQDLITGECHTTRHYLSQIQLKEISAFCYMAWLEAHGIGRVTLFD